MKLNQDYRVVNIVIYDDKKTNTIIERKVNPYQSKTVYIATNIYGENYTNENDDFDFIIDNVKVVKNQTDHIESNERKNNTFIVVEPGTIQGTLYISINKVVKWEGEEQRDERKSGITYISYNDILTFTNDIKIVFRDSSVVFLKKTDAYNSNYRDLTELTEEIKQVEERKTLFTKWNYKERYINLLKQKLKEGYEYKALNYKCAEVVTNNLKFYNPIDHAEKTKEYIKLEKLTKDIKVVCSHWGIDDTIELLKSYTLTKRRKAAN